MMLQYRFISIISLIVLSFQMYSCSRVQAQPGVSGKISSYDQRPLKLQRYFLDKAITVDSTQTDQNGGFHFEMKDQTAGQYRILLTNSQAIEFIFDHQDIEFTTDAQDPNENLQIVKSEIFRDYNNYLNQRDQASVKLEMLTPMLEYFPKEDTFYLQIRKKFLDEQMALIDYRKKLIAKNKGNFLARYMASDQRVILNADLGLSGQRAFLQQHALDFVDFDDTTLLNSNLFNGKVMDYLGLYQNNQLDKPQLEREYIRAVDHVLSRAMFNDVVFQHIMEFLVNGFEHFYFTEVVTYIAENFELSESCQNLERKNELQEKLQAYQRLAIGKAAPEIIMKDVKGNELQLSKIKAENTLVIFWASWCPHCKEILPELSEFYNSIDKKDLEIVAISLDKKPEELQEYLNQNKSSLVHACDYKGWDTPAAIDYHIYSTPTLLLLDKNKNIIGRPENVSQVIEAMR
ncbi:MAG: redoxin domain-containing protein [Bacteroidales bacterium]|nr:redoxin domain-containing protein [Bacteroidales bacterium]